MTGSTNRTRMLGVAVVLAATTARAQEAAPPPSAPSVTAVVPEGAPAAPAPPPMAYPPPSPFGFYQREILFDATSADAILETERYGQWQAVCRAHCRTMAAVGSKYRVGGDGVSNSKTFTVHPSPNPVVVHADAGSSGGRNAGLLVTIAGGAAMTVGIVLLSLESVCVMCNGAEKSERRGEAAKTWVPVLVIGAGGIAAGIVVMVSNRTRLDFAPGAAAWTPRLKLGKGLELTSEGIGF